MTIKIGVVSDLHLGFGYNTEYENDSFELAREAFENMLDCDLILVAGDVFDSRSPRTATWGKALQVFSIPLRGKSDIELVDTDKKLFDASLKTLSSIPVIALHGNHERRTRSEINPVQALERGGFLIHLHQNRLVFKKDGMQVAIFGMSNVPEAYALQMLQNWNPKPLENAFNILMLHQNIHPYVYSPLDIPSIRIGDLPKGFDLIINGHVHKKAIDKLGNTTLLITGSSIVTQFEKNESEEEKGYYKITLNENNFDIQFIPFKNQRKFIYLEIKKDVVSEDDIKEKISGALSQQFSKKPIIKVKVITKANQTWEANIKKIENQFKEKAIVKISKEIVSEEYRKSIELLREIRDKSLSIEEISANILRKNLEAMGFDFNLINYEEIMRILEEDVDKALNILTNKQKTLGRFV